VRTSVVLYIEGRSGVETERNAITIKRGVRGLQLETKTNNMQTDSDSESIEVSEK
jgi:hypothetical protein